MKESLYEIALILENISKKDTPFTKDLEQLSELIYHLWRTLG